MTGDAGVKRARRASQREASSSGNKPASAAQRRIAEKAAKSAAPGEIDAFEAKRRGRSPRRVVKSSKETVAAPAEGPSLRRRRVSVSAPDDGSGTDIAVPRRRRRSSIAEAPIAQSEGGSSGISPTSTRRTGGRKQRQLEAIAAGMLEQEQGDKVATTNTEPGKKVRLPSFQEMDSLVKQRKAGKLPHIELTTEEGPHIAAHLVAFSKSAKMRESARALYINNQV